MSLPRSPVQTPERHAIAEGTSGTVVQTPSRPITRAFATASEATAANGIETPAKTNPPKKAAINMDQIMAHISQLKAELDKAKAEAARERAERLKMEHELANLRVQAEPRVIHQPTVLHAPAPADADAMLQLNNNMPSCNAVIAPTPTARESPNSLQNAVQPTPTTAFRATSSNADAMIESGGGNNTSMLNSSLVMPGTAAYGRKLFDLPTFSGRPEEWPVFMAAFEQSTSAYNYTALENNFRLQKSLKGDAREAVEMLLMHPNNVDEAVEALRFQFGRPELLVASQLAKVQAMPSFSDRNLGEMVPFTQKVRNLVAYLQQCGSEYELLSPNLLNDLLRKMPMSQQLRWTDYAANMPTRQTVTDLSKWLPEAARRACLMPQVSDALNNRSNQPQRRSATSNPSTNQASQNARYTTMYASQTVRSCKVCVGSHHTSECPTLQADSTPNRWKRVKGMRLCFGCLEEGHSMVDCHRRKRCNVGDCNYSHHPLLHNANETSTRRHRNPFRRESRTSADDAGSTAAEAAATSETHCGVVMDQLQPSYNAHAVPVGLEQFGAEQKRSVLFRIVPIRIHGRNKTIDTYAMVDDGSELSMIEEELANELGLSGPAVETSYQWIQQHSTNVSSTAVSFELSGIGPHHKRFRMQDVRTVRNIGLPTQSVSIDILGKKFGKHLPVAEYLHGKARVLIGLDNSHVAVPMKTVLLGSTGPIAVKMPIGWTIYGRGGDRTRSTSRLYFASNKSETLYELDRLIKDFFTTESFGVKVTAPLESQADARAKCILDATTARTGTRYQTGLLWRSDDVTLPRSYEMAVRRLSSIESKMGRDPSYAALYRSNVAAYIEKGYARKLSADEIAETSRRTWYLPHFGVTNSNKPGKLRLVFDAAASIDGVSLNSVLLSGPNSNTPLAALLHKFRVGDIGVCGDIREMFHQVVIRPEDRCAQRFLWRDGDRTAAPTVYEMVAMTFGATCSPATAQYVMNRNADEHAADFPQAVRPIKELHYVDDYVASFSTAAEAIDVTLAVTEVHRLGGFELRNFVSNNEAVLRSIGAPVRTDPVDMQPESEHVVDRVLGMAWDTKTDMFLFQPNLARIGSDVVEGRRRPSKREVLSAAMSVFDPYGMVAEFVLYARLIVQDLCNVGIGWDQPLPDNLYARWTKWCAALETLHLCRVPRCYSRSILKSKNIQLHIFADASERAFAAVAYFRVERADEVDVAFVAGRTRCAPIKMLSVPRLELQAAVLAVRLRTAIMQCHADVDVARTVFWTDSRCVVQWVRSDHRRYKPFVAHRIAEILSESTQAEWRWVPTKSNVADDATRAHNVPDVSEDSRWLKGPPFLRQEEDDWPTDAVTNADSETKEELKSKPYVLIVQENAPVTVDFARFSLYGRVVRAVAYCLRFAHNASNRRLAMAKRTGPIAVSEFKAAEAVVCTLAQRSAYAAEMDDLSSGKPVCVRSSIKSLMPYMDGSLLRMHGRTDAADENVMALSTKRPILMPTKHVVTELLVRHHHIRIAHTNDDAVICAVRSTFWIPKLRSVVRRIRANCMACRVRSARPNPPVMGQLPVDRLTPNVRAFTYTGMDFFGPVSVAIGRRREKRWVCLFTCMTVRAVHLELAEDLSTDACLVCIRNFCNLRGAPVRIRSDNGTNFVGASKVVKDATSFLDRDRMADELSSRGIEWVFNSPGHPEAGGCWERLVQCVKRVLVNVLAESAPRVETLRCVLLEAANIVNSRPLTYVPVTPEAEEPITPNHFLVGRHNSTTVPTEDAAKMLDMRKQWRIARHMSRCFWAQWVRAYLPELTRRTKWHTDRPNICVGDLVLVCDTNVSRGQWRRGRVTAVYPGRDGRVRNAELRTMDGVLKRPVSKLAFLDVKC